MQAMPQAGRAVHGIRVEDRRCGLGSAQSDSIHIFVVKLRFGHHRATQSTLAKIADKYMGKVGEPCRLMLFGKASFAAKEGRASAPRKAMIREMAGWCHDAE
jgi:hypothetical protein